MWCIWRGHNNLMFEDVESLEDLLLASMAIYLIGLEIEDSHLVISFLVFSKLIPPTKQKIFHAPPVRPRRYRKI